MSDWSISKQIGAITMGLLGVLVVIAGTGLYSSFNIGKRVTDIASAADSVALTEAAVENMYRAEAAKADYRFNATPEVAAAFENDIVNVVDTGRKLSELYGSDPILGPAIDQVIQAAQAQLASFESVIDWHATREVAVTTMDDLGPRILQELNTVSSTMIFDQNQRAMLAVRDGRQEYLLGRIYAERYLLTNAPEDLAIAQSHLDKAIGLVATGAEVSKIDARKKAIGLVTEMIEHYQGALADAGLSIEGRNGVRAEMSQNAALLRDNLSTISDALLDRQTAARAQAARTQLVSTALLAALALIGLVGGTVFSRRFARSIGTSVDGSIHAMTELAEGTLDIDIPGQESQNEFGDIARALVVFRDTAREGKALEARNKAAEEEHRRQEQEQAEREQKAELARQAKAEADRKAVITSLRDSLGGVVDAAAAGDFSRRISTRFDEPELQSMAASINTLVETVEAGVTETAQVLAALATGDLTERMQGDYDGRFADLKTSVNETIDTLAQLVSEIASQCNGLSGEVQGMTSQSADLSRRAEEQAASIEETSAVMEEMLASVKSSADGTQSASDTAARATAQVEEAGEVVGRAVAAMGDIRTASQSIGEIVAVIEGIAFQTNLLALNASVEAARAGSAGKGFSVVATEVRALAQRSSEASQDIKKLIETTAEQVNHGVTLVETTGTTLTEIVQGVRDMAGVMTELSTSAREQAAGVQEATSAISQVDIITQKNAALADESRATAARVKQQTGTIQEMISSFRLTHPTGLDQPDDALAAGFAAE